MRTAPRGGRATGFLDLLLSRLSFRTQSSAEVSRKRLPVTAGAVPALSSRKGGKLTCLQRPRHLGSRGAHPVI